MEPAVSLSTLAKKYSLPMDKGLFPHSMSKSIQNLKYIKKLPNYADVEWFKVLTNSHPSPEEVEQAFQDFETSKATNLY